MVNSQVIVLVCVVGAGAAVLIGYAIHNFFFKPGADDNKAGVGDEFSQAQYMREVRLRYAEQMAGSNGYGRRWYGLHFEII